MVPCGARYEYPANTSILDMGAAKGAAGGGVGLCPYKLDDPSPTAHATSRIRLREPLGRENMRLSSAILMESDLGKANEPTANDPYCTCLHKKLRCHLITNSLIQAQHYEW